MIEKYQKIILLYSSGKPEDLFKAKQLFKRVERAKIHEFINFLIDYNKVQRMREIAKVLRILTEKEIK